MFSSCNFYPSVLILVAPYFNVFNSFRCLKHKPLKQREGILKQFKKMRICAIFTEKQCFKKILKNKVTFRNKKQI